eukprot:COSAG02_NODE_12233_length_1576_cov_1.526066_1_plen_86_part_10
MNSFRIEWIESFHAISHGIPVRPASGPRLLEARQEWVELETCAFVCLAETRTTAPSRFEGAVVQGSAPGGAWQPSYTVPNSVHFEA